MGRALSGGSLAGGVVVGLDDLVGVIWGAGFVVAALSALGAMVEEKRERCFGCYPDRKIKRKIER